MKTPDAARRFCLLAAATILTSVTNLGATGRPGDPAGNSWDLYDMCGNVWEWCLDLLATIYDGASPSDGRHDDGFHLVRNVEDADGGDDTCSKPQAGPMVPIETDLPKAIFVGTEKDIRVPRVKPVQTEAGPPFLAPKGTTNVALGKPVSASDEEPVIGELTMITDGDKEGADGSYVELGPLLQHVTIDLQDRCEIYGLRVWHFHKEPRVYFDVIARISDDPNFVKDVETVFNNDMDNSAGLNPGTDMHYVDTRYGEIIDARGYLGRYVRLYSRGNTADDLNHYIEVEVYGRPADR